MPSAAARIYAAEPSTLSGAQRPWTADASADHCLPGVDPANLGLFGCLVGIGGWEFEKVFMPGELPSLIRPWTTQNPPLRARAGAGATVRGRRLSALGVARPGPVFTAPPSRSRGRCLGGGVCVPWHNVGPLASPKPQREPSLFGSGARPSPLEHDATPTAAMPQSTQAWNTGNPQQPSRSDLDASPSSARQAVRKQPNRFAATPMNAKPPSRRRPKELVREELLRSLETQQESSGIQEKEKAEPRNTPSWGGALHEVKQRTVQIRQRTLELLRRAEELEAQQKQQGATTSMVASSSADEVHQSFPVPMQAEEILGEPNKASRDTPQLVDSNSTRQQCVDQGAEHKGESRQVCQCFHKEDADDQHAAFSEHSSAEDEKKGLDTSQEFGTDVLDSSQSLVFEDASSVLQEPLVGSTERLPMGKARIGPRKTTVLKQALRNNMNDTNALSLLELSPPGKKGRKNKIGAHGTKSLASAVEEEIGTRMTTVSSSQEGTGPRTATKSSAGGAQEDAGSRKATKSSAGGAGDTVARRVTKSKTTGMQEDIATRRTTKSRSSGLQEERPQGQSMKRAALARCRSLETDGSSASAKSEARSDASDADSEASMRSDGSWRSKGASSDGKKMTESSTPRAKRLPSGSHHPSAQMRRTKSSVLVRSRSTLKADVEDRLDEEKVLETGRRMDLAKLDIAAASSKGDKQNLHAAHIAFFENLKTRELRVEVHLRALNRSASMKVSAKEIDSLLEHCFEAAQQNKAVNSAKNGHKYHSIVPLLSLAKQGSELELFVSGWQRPMRPSLQAAKMNRELLSMFHKTQEALM